jgi:flavin-dependent dehydrogenase
VPLSTPDASDVSALKQQGRKRIRLPRVAIVGAGFVGSTTAFALLISGTAAEIVLIDQDRRRGKGGVGSARSSHKTWNEAYDAVLQNKRPGITPPVSHWQD